MAPNKPQQAIESSQLFLYNLCIVWLLYVYCMYLLMFACAVSVYHMVDTCTEIGSMAQICNVM